MQHRGHNAGRAICRCRDDPVPSGIFLIDGDGGGIERVHGSGHRIDGAELLRQLRRATRNVEATGKSPTPGKSGCDTVAHGVPHVDQMLLRDPLAAHGGLVLADQLGDREPGVLAHRKQFVRAGIGTKPRSMRTAGICSLYRCRRSCGVRGVVELDETSADREEAAFEKRCPVGGEGAQFDGVRVAKFLVVGAKRDGDVIQRQCCAADECDRPAGSIRQRADVRGVDSSGVGAFEAGEYRARRAMPAARGSERTE